LDFSKTTVVQKHNIDDNTCLVLLIFLGAIKLRYFCLHQQIKKGPQDRDNLLGLDYAELPYLLFLIVLTFIDTYLNNLTLHSVSFLP